jgi:deoxyribodipyrimidine photolyase-related protein
MSSSRSARHLVVVLGDQLNRDASAFDDFDDARDRVWMAEAGDESSHVWSHKQRIVLFLSAMRHFRDGLRKAGVAVDYTALDDKENCGSLRGELERSLKSRKPARVIATEPGEWRVLQMLREACEACGVPLELRIDRHFLGTVDDFRAHAGGRKELRMEYFYREMRKRHEVLMDDGKPVGGAWNFDKENRKSFGRSGPGEVPPPTRSEPDEITREVMELVGRRFAEHPGSLDSFAWPVTRRSALAALRRFIDERLPLFGDFQDALWTDEPFLYHSLIASSLNLKLLDPREVIAAAEQAYRDGVAPLPAVEGFIRQILGWREYVRGVYWLHMPEYLERNALDADAELPEFFWTGDTPMNCLRDTIAQTLEHGYAHHIQRLMITGLYSLLLGVRPQAVHEWYLAVYVDAVEWVELPNTLGMSQFADGGVMASKPYCASGKYIDRMSNYCKGCRFDPAEATGERACPFTTLYWEFLIRNEASLQSNQRMRMQLRNLGRLSDERREGILARAAEVRGNPAMLEC